MSSSNSGGESGRRDLEQLENEASLLDAENTKTLTNGQREALDKIQGRIRKLAEGLDSPKRPRT